VEEHMFPNFLHDSQEYQQAEKLWQDGWQELVQQSGQLSLWKTSWLNTSFGDGTPFQDGNPIFSAIRSDRRIAVRVIQLDPAETPGDFDYWYDEFPAGEAEKGEELVIGCALTKNNVSKAMDIMKGFIETGEKARLPA
jgi:hypothetical protein